MLRQRSIALGAGTVLVGLLVAAAGARPTASDETGFRPLFDGKTLEGWKASEKPENWKVEDGTIVGRGGRSHLFYVAEEFQDFVFRAEVLTQPKTNSGIFFHSRFQEGGWPRYGYECQVNVTQGDPVKTGSLYNTVLLYETPAKDGKWWTQEIRVKGKKITVRIDGKIVLDFIEPPGVTGTRRLSRGLFALQQHDPGSVVRYRNIRVKKL